MNSSKLRKRIVWGTAVLALFGAIGFAGYRAEAGAANHEPATMNEAKPSDPQSPDAKGRRERHKCCALLEEAASVIGIDKAELKKELKAGKSIADVAKAKGVDETVLTDRLLALRTQQIDEAVRSGKWTAEKAERVKQKLPERLKTLLHRKGTDFPHHKK